MEFHTEHVRIRHVWDCWGVSTRAGEGAKAEWLDDRWYFSSLQGAVMKALELEVALEGPDEAAPMAEVAARIDEAYARIYKAIDEIEVK